MKKICKYGEECLLVWSCWSPRKTLDLVPQTRDHSVILTHKMLYVWIILECKMKQQIQWLKSNLPIHVAPGAPWSIFKAISGQNGAGSCRCIIFFPMTMMTHEISWLIVQGLAVAADLEIPVSTSSCTSAQCNECNGHQASLDVRSVARSFFGNHRSLSPSIGRPDLQQGRTALKVRFGRRAIFLEVEPTIGWPVRHVLSLQDIDIVRCGQSSCRQELKLASTSRARRAALLFTWSVNDSAEP